MTKENNAQPKPLDIARSMFPYLFGGKSSLAGTVSVQETNLGRNLQSIRRQNIP
ncbi:hypothetical protein [Candidatus Leptofilum sp.]|uniref:hypothetical protein n=1 Tax=Candidatus Leptofilum sp. TaxID=3241576 RepID=UPI003B5CC516